jgi:hypothetical protein
MLLWAAGAAFADPPNQTVRLWPINTVDGAEVERMAVSPSGNVVAGRTRGDFSGWMLDLDGWVLKTFKPNGCDVTGVAPVPLEGGDEELWISCKDGSVRVKSWNGVTLTDAKDDDGQLIQFDGVDVSLSGIWYDDGFNTGSLPLLYALYAPETGPLLLHVIDPFELATDSLVFPSYPKQLYDDGFVEAVVTTDSKLIVAHGGENVTWIQLGSDSAPPMPNQFAGAVACDDLAASPFGGAYCVGTTGVAGSLGAAAEFRPFTNQW